MRPALLAALLAAVGAAGCGWPKPKADPTEFYVLTAAAPPLPKAARRPVVELADVELPDYLNNPRMAARTGQNEIDYAEFRRWAEPLAQGVARALREGLADSAEVRQAPVPGAAYRLSVRVLAFEGVRAESGGGGARVSAVWELRRGKGPPRRQRFSSEPKGWDGKDYAELARLESAALGELCAKLREALSAAQKR